jgi:hypothetical protein
MQRGIDNNERINQHFESKARQSEFNYCRAKIKISVAG